MVGRALRVILESWMSTIGFALVAFWVVAALGADLLAPFPPNATLAPLQRPLADAIIPASTMLERT